MNSMSIPDTTIEYEYILKNASSLSKYAGEWIAVLGEKVICHNKNLINLGVSIDKLHPGKIPVFMKVPTEKHYAY